MSLEVCAPWTDAARLCCPDGTIDDCVDGPGPAAYVWDDDELIMLASNLLYAWTGYRWPGLCEDLQIWPCIDGCTSPAHACAACCRYDAFVIPSDYIVVEVTAVEEDGVALPTTSYRLEPGNRVVRLDGLRWQRNTFGLPNCTGVETVVTYNAGAAPPMPGQMAAAALACELKKACAGDNCTLGPHVRAFARRGVQVELTDLKDLVQSGSTGIAEVDYFLRAYGDLARAPSMVDPARPSRGSRYIP